MAEEKVNNVEDLQEGDPISVNNPLFGERGLAIVIDRKREYLYDQFFYDEEAGEEKPCRWVDPEDGEAYKLTPEDEGRDKNATELRIDAVGYDGSSSMNFKEITHGDDVLDQFEVHKVDEDSELYDAQWVDYMREKEIPFLKMMEKNMEGDEDLTDEGSAYYNLSTSQIVGDDSYLKMADSMLQSLKQMDGENMMNSSEDRENSDMGKYVDPDESITRDIGENEKESEEHIQGVARLASDEIEPVQPEPEPLNGEVEVGYEEMADDEEAEDDVGYEEVNENLNADQENND